MATSGFRILVVDSDSTQSEIISRVMLNTIPKDVDYMVFHAESIEKAANILEKECLDIIVSDLDLSDSSGLDVVRSLHSLCPEIPLIVFSSVENTHMAVEAIKHGAAFYVYKSNIDTLPLAVLLIVEKHLLRKQFTSMFMQVARSEISRIADETLSQINRSMSTIKPIEGLEV